MIKKYSRWGWTRKWPKCRYLPELRSCIVISAHWHSETAYRIDDFTSKTILKMFMFMFNENVWVDWWKNACEDSKNNFACVTKGNPCTVHTAIHCHYIGLMKLPECEENWDFTSCSYKLILKWLVHGLHWCAISNIFLLIFVGKKGQIFKTRIDNIIKFFSKE